MKALYLQAGLDPFGAIPLTFVVRNGSSDPEFVRWRQTWETFDAEVGQRMWLVKPGDRGNRGCGIGVYDTLEDVSKRIDAKAKVWVIQKYIEQPLLVHKRKFDMRAYALVRQESSGEIRAFAYRDAYLRTTSVQYTTKNLDKMIHLNNDAVQKNGEDYGKFESANKMSLEEFQKYLDTHHSKDGINVRQRIMPQISGLMADAVRAAAPRLNPRGIQGCFEVYGFDFMIDSNFRVWMIEVNANPCLDLCSAYLSSLIPTMLDHALILTVDRFFDGDASRQRSRGDLQFGGESGTKWDPIFDSSSQDAMVPSAAPWLEPLPEDYSEDSCQSLGRLILGRKVKKKNGRKSKAAAEQVENSQAASGERTASPI
jgi:hypothetical protein